MKVPCASCGEAVPAGASYCPFCAGAIPGALIHRSRVRSAEIISHMARTCGRTEEEATAAVDGFWEYLSNRAHYTHGDGDRLVIPHFGTFRRDPPLRPIAFLSRDRSKLGGAPSSGWIDRLRSAPGQLSVRRRIIATIAQAKGLDLRVAHELVSGLFAVLTEIFLRGRARILWAKRGVMGPARGRYRLRLYPSFAKRLR